MSFARPAHFNTALDIPQCSGQYRRWRFIIISRRDKTGPVHYPASQVADTRRIFPYQAVGKLMYCRLTVRARPSMTGFPANHAFIRRFDFQEHPTWR